MQMQKTDVWTQCCGGSRGMNWKIETDIYTLPSLQVGVNKQWDSTCTICYIQQGSAHGSVMTQMGGMGGCREEVKRQGYMYTYSWFILLYNPETNTHCKTTLPQFKKKKVQHQISNHPAKLSSWNKYNSSQEIKCPPTIKPGILIVKPHFDQLKSAEEHRGCQ